MSTNAISKKRKLYHANGSNSNSNSNSGSNGFKTFGLSDIVYQGIVKMGFRMPTPVQRKAIPILCSGIDTCIMARTGSGKTLAFCIPLLEKVYSILQSQGTSLSSSSNSNNNNTIKGIILSPTRELSQQTLVVLNKLTSVVGSGTDSSSSTSSSYPNNHDGIRKIRCIGITGGDSMEQQFSMLASHPDIIVATPGRLAHHITEITDLQLSSCQVCILDEADRLVEMGFTIQIKQIMKSIASSSSTSISNNTLSLSSSNHLCQKIMCSATMPKMLLEFTKSGYCSSDHMEIIRLDHDVTVSAELRIAFITTRSLEKDAALLHVMDQIIQDRDSNNSNVSKESSQDDTNEENDNDNAKSSSSSTSARTGLTLIFAATRHHVEYIHTLLSAAGMNTTMIYGTLDQVARQTNLAQFRSGKKPILVVTDVAARGIDVPLIDHVIHYQFPFSPKLFIHRSGRAARAGRIGFCWCLVEPDEMPYMIDLHLFLGRRPMNADQIENEQHKSYTLNEMTPDMVHYGSLPESIATAEVENVTRIMNSELSGSLEAEALRSLTKVCKNAMIQYRRTRSEASKEGVRRAKAILEGDRNSKTGQRIGNGAIPPHPLLRHTELMIHSNKQSINTKTGHINDLQNLQQRDEFLRTLSNFRPKESVFEAFATGKSKDTAVVSHLDKGRTMKNKKNDSSVALTAMKNMRRQMHMIRDKSTCLVVAGSDDARIANGESVTTTILDESNEHQQNDRNIEHDLDDGNDDVETSSKAVSSILNTAQVHIDHTKRRMSRAERKRFKINPESVQQHQDDVYDGMDDHHHNSNNKKLKTDFRDTAYFIDHDISSNQDEVDRSRMMEAALQPSSSSAAPRGIIKTALRLEETMMDLVGDENDDIVKKQRMMRWDKSKRKYVQTTVGEELSGESKSKKLRTESGQLMKSNKLKLGELYQRWQKKTNRSIGRTGVLDDNNNMDGSGIDTDYSSRGRNKKTATKSSPNNNGTKKKSGDEIKTAMDIKKERDKKQNMKLKNMKKSERRVVEQKQMSSSRNNKGGGSKASFKPKGKGKISKKR